MVVAEDEAIEDHKVSGSGPRRETQARSNATIMMSWDIELEIVCSSDRTKTTVAMASSDIEDIDDVFLVTDEVSTSSFQ